MASDLTRENVEEVVAAARALVEAHERRHPDYAFATESEQTAFRALLHAVGLAVEDGYALS